MIQNKTASKKKQTCFAIQKPGFFQFSDPIWKADHLTTTLLSTVQNPG